MAYWYILTADRTPIPATHEEFVLWEKDNSRVVAKSYLADGVEVSTVFLGLNHSFFFGTPPLIFETMIFGGQYRGYTTRCSTWLEALGQHKAAVLLVKGGKKT